jgi:hypothetical protein
MAAVFFVAAIGLIVSITGAIEASLMGIRWNEPPGVRKSRNVRAEVMEGKKKNV